MLLIKEVTSSVFQGYILTELKSQALCRERAQYPLCPLNLVTMLELQLLYGLWIAWPETWTQGSCYPKIFSHTTKRILLTRLSKCLTEINILFSDGFLRTVVLVSGGAWAGVSPHGLYLILVLSHQPTPLAGAHFRTSILAHHLSASWRPFLQTGKEGSSDLPS